jgi:4-amino-4-deoxychorismate lyase
MPRLVTCEEWRGELRRKRVGVQGKYLAFYSSYLEMITTDAVDIQLPLDDHLIHRGHGVYDTGTVAKGRLYQFRRHVDRLLASARKSLIATKWSADEIVSLAKETVSVSGARDCSLRLWISPGPGNFSITSEKCEPCLYILVYVSDAFPSDPYSPQNETTVSVADVPMKAAAFASVKSVNYMLNAQMAAAAKRKGGNLGLWVDGDENVTEGSVCNFAVVTPTGEFVTPPFEGILAGCTLLHIFEILCRLGISYSQRKISRAELMASDEVLTCGGDTHVFGVVSVDGQLIGNGRLGKVTTLLIDTIQKELATGIDCDSVPIYS